MTPSNPYGRRPSTVATPAGAATPRDLHARLKLVELYTLHVLPRNEEWELAHAFLSNSEHLDDEKKEAFLGALESLKRETQEQERQREADRIAEERRLREAEAEEAKRQQESDRLAREQSQISRREKREKNRPTTTNPQPQSPHPKRNRNRNPPQRRAPATMAERLTTMFQSFKGALNRTPVMRALLMILLVWILFGRKVEFRHLLVTAWRKMLATIGMGVKVSYI